MPTKAELEEELIDLRRAHRTLEIQHAAFRTQVRETAIEVASNQGWCSSGVNETLEELDLPKIPDSYRRTSLIRVTHIWERQGEDIPDANIESVSIGGGWNVSFDVEEFEIVDIGETEEVFDE